MSKDLLNRRMIITGAAAVAAGAMTMRTSMAAALPPIEPSELTAGTWFEQVKAQHTAIAGTLTDLIAVGGSPSPARNRALKQLSYLLTAHSVAEENALYPQLVFVGLTVESSDLYLEQQFQKVWNAELDSKNTQGDSGADFIGKLQKLQAAILEHAKAHEEDDYYPKLQAKLTAAENAVLTNEFRTQFLQIKEP